MQRYRGVNFTPLKLFVLPRLSIALKPGFKPRGQSLHHKRFSFRDGNGNRQTRNRGLTTMARIEFTDSFGGGAAVEAEVLFELGMMYATGRDCELDFVTAHKWFNIAAIKGSERAADMRREMASTMSKHEIARALRDARSWMSLH
jgi:uncharacterized protein